MQKQLVREHNGNAKPKDDTFESVESSCAEVKRLISWLEYVNENEFDSTERGRLISAAQRFARVAQPIASKYLD